MVTSVRTELVVRACRPDEIPHVLALWRESRGRLGETDDASGLRTLLERDRDALIVAESGGHVVGTLIAAFDGWRGNMYRLSVHSAHRRRGVAVRLLAAGEELLRARGARRVTALVWQEDGAAVRAWEASDTRTRRARAAS